MTNRKRQTRSLEPKSASTDAPGSDWASRAATAVQRWSRHPILRTLQWALACFVIGGGGFLLVASADAKTPWFGPSAAERLGTAYMYDEEGSLLSETGTGGPNSSDSIQHIYLPTADGPMPVAVIINGAIYAVHSDQLNTPRKITNASGQTVWQWAYSAFGDDAPTTAANRFTGPHTVPKTGTTSVSPITYNIRYPGTYDDKESGLLENGYRSYAPSQGRYTQGDPIGLDGGWSRFNYVDGNPLGYVDPDGLAPKRPTDGLPPAIYSPTTGRPAGVSPVPGWRPAQIGGLGGSRPAGSGRSAVIDPSCLPMDNPSLSAHKEALRAVHDEVGALPKGAPGKFGSPQAGDSKKGYRLDPPHDGAARGDAEAMHHFNWWDYSGGKRGSGGRSGAIPIKD